MLKPILNYSHFVIPRNPNPTSPVLALAAAFHPTKFQRQPKYQHQPRQIRRQFLTTQTRRYTSNKMASAKEYRLLCLENPLLGKLELCSLSQTG